MNVAPGGVVLQLLVIPPVHQLHITLTHETRPRVVDANPTLARPTAATPATIATATHIVFITLNLQHHLTSSGLQHQ